MIRSLVIILVKVLEAKLEKVGIESAILKNQNYITVAKQVWDMVDENFRISKSIEEKLTSKIDTFNKALLKEFPELSQDDIDKLRQSVAGAVNVGKEAVLDNSAIIKQLQEENANLKVQNASLTDQLSKVQSLVTSNTTTTAVDNNSAAIVQAQA